MYGWQHPQFAVANATILQQQQAYWQQYGYAGAQPPLPAEPTVKPAPPVSAPTEEKPPLPNEPPPPEAPPPPGPPDEDKSNKNQVTSLQQQWQGYQQDMATYPHQPQGQQTHQQKQTPRPQEIPATANPVQRQQMIEIQTEEEQFEQQYTDWVKQYNDWKEQNKNHPDKTQFEQYEQQFKQYEAQMDEKRTDINKRKQAVLNEINANQQPAAPQSNWGNPSFSTNQPPPSLAPPMPGGPNQNFNRPPPGFNQGNRFNQPPPPSSGFGYGHNINTSQGNVPSSQGAYNQSQGDESQAKSIQAQSATTPVNYNQLQRGGMQGNHNQSQGMQQKQFQGGPNQNQSGQGQFGGQRMPYINNRFNQPGNYDRNNQGPNVRGPSPYGAPKSSFSEGNVAEENISDDMDLDDNSQSDKTEDPHDFIGGQTSMGSYQSPGRGAMTNRGMGDRGADGRGSRWGGFANEGNKDQQTGNIGRGLDPMNRGRGGFQGNRGRGGYNPSVPPPPYDQNALDAGDQEAENDFEYPQTSIGNENQSFGGPNSQYGRGTQNFRGRGMGNRPDMNNPRGGYGRGGYEQSGPAGNQGRCGLLRNPPNSGNEDDQEEQQGFYQGHAGRGRGGQFDPYGNRDPQNIFGDNQQGPPGTRGRGNRFGLPQGMGRGQENFQERQRNFVQDPDQWDKQEEDYEDDEQSMNYDQSNMGRGRGMSQSQAGPGRPSLLGRVPQGNFDSNRGGYNAGRGRGGQQFASQHERNDGNQFEPEQGRPGLLGSVPRGRGMRGGMQGRFDTGNEDDMQQQQSMPGGRGGFGPQGARGARGGAMSQRGGVPGQPGRFDAMHGNNMGRGRGNFQQDKANDPSKPLSLMDMNVRPPPPPSSQNMTSKESDQNFEDGDTTQAHKSDRVSKDDFVNLEAMSMEAMGLPTGFGMDAFDEDNNSEEQYSSMQYNRGRGNRGAPSRGNSGVPGRFQRGTGARGARGGRGGRNNTLDEADFDAAVVDYQNGRGRGRGRGMDRGRGRGRGGYGGQQHSGGVHENVDKTASSLFSKDQLDLLKKTAAELQEMNSQQETDAKGGVEVVASNALGGLVPYDEEEDKEDGYPGDTGSGNDPLDDVLASGRNKSQKLQLIRDMILKERSMALQEDPEFFKRFESPRPAPQQFERDQREDPFRDPFREPARDPYRAPEQAPLRDPYLDPYRDPLRDRIRDPPGRDQYGDPLRDPYRVAVRDPYRDPLRDPYRDPMRDPARDPLRDPVREPLRDPYRDPIRDPLRDPMRDPLRDPLRDPTRDPLRDPYRDPVRDPYRDPYAGRGRDPYARGVSPPAPRVRTPPPPAVAAPQVIEYGHGGDEKDSRSQTSDSRSDMDRRTSESDARQRDFDSRSQRSQERDREPDRWGRDRGRDDRFDRSRDRDSDRRRETRDRDSRRSPDRWRDSDRGRSDFDRSSSRFDRDRGRSNNYRDDRTRDRSDDRERHRDRERDRPGIRRDPFGRDMSMRKEFETKPEGNYDPYSKEAAANKPKAESISVEDLFCEPGRKARPENIVIIVRGPSGAGKSYVSKLLKEKEISNGGSAPRIMSIDDYFMVENEKMEKDPESDRIVRKTVLEYEYDPDMEESYKQSFFKTFKKQIENMYFSFIIVDAVNERGRHLEEYYTYAKSHGFQVYVAEVMAEASVCAKRNIHSRSYKEIEKMISRWEEAPSQIIRLDLRSLLQDDAIDDVEMEDAGDKAKASEKDGDTKPSEENEKKKENEEKNGSTADEEEDVAVQGFFKSKWDDTSENKLDKLDGLRHKKVHEHMTMEEFLEISDDYETRKQETGKKHVRWADIEEKKSQERMRDIGFVVGQTDWNKMMDDSHAEKALNRTKFI